ncbi:hypothetical protein EB796_019271 [Bugula neritina]|uniref:Uncharacterized protein n=1 Tax=Bugula neritina TaxID=10212 RepID=A0A7J7J8S1_BUGNE|nr:hypothetical protein EB796_019271 [Bugula neritina]
MHCLTSKYVVHFVEAAQAQGQLLMRQVLQTRNHGSFLKIQNHNEIAPEASFKCANNVFALSFRSFSPSN